MAKEPHGDKYLYISEWLSKKMTGNSKNYVPYIVDSSGCFSQISAIYLSRSVFARIDAAAIAVYVLSPPTTHSCGICRETVPSNFIYGFIY